MATRSRRYEFKVEYGCSNNDKKWVKFYVEEEEMNGFTMDALDVRLREKCGFPCAKIRYQDRSQDWIDLRHDDIDSFIDMVETAAEVTERNNIFRITLKVSGVISPSQAQVLDDSTSGKRIHSPSPVKTNSKKRARSHLHYGESSGEKDKKVQDVSAVCDYVSPTQKLFDKLQLDKKEAQREVSMKEKELIELEQSYKNATDARSAQGQGALCTKCHNSGHNRTRCDFATCISATICGDIKRHPDENKYLKDQRADLKRSKARLAQIELDIKAKNETYKAVQNTFAAKIQTDLINSDPKRYLHSTQDGYPVPNWLLVNSDIRKLERVCHGKIPPKSEIQTKLKNYNDSFDILSESHDNETHDRGHRNPVKDLWQRKGVRFPGKEPLPNSERYVESVHDILARNGLGPIQESDDESDPDEAYEGLNLLFRAATFSDNRQ